MKAFRRAEHVVTTQMDETLLMLNIPQSLYHSLNAIGARIWELIGEPITEPELIDTLMKEFNVSQEVCVRDVREFLRLLRERKLIVEEA